MRLRATVRQRKQPVPGCGMDGEVIRDSQATPARQDQTPLTAEHEDVSRPRVRATLEAVERSDTRMCMCLEEAPASHQSKEDRCSDKGGDCTDGNLHGTDYPRDCIRSYQKRGSKHSRQREDT
jgi:hypothetical protein